MKEEEKEKGGIREQGGEKGEGQEWRRKMRKRMRLEEEDEESRDIGSEGGKKQSKWKKDGG